MTVVINELVALRVGQSRSLTFPLYGEDERAWHIPEGWQEISYETMDLCDGDLTLTSSVYRRGDLALHVGEYLRADDVEINYTLTRG